MFPQTIPMFAKCFYVNKIDIDSHKILKGITEKFIPSADGTNTDLSQTSIDKNVLNKTKWKTLKNLIMKELKTYTENVLEYNNKFRMTTSWFTSSAPAKESEYHCHKNSMISCCLYIQCDQDSGNISFMNYKQDDMFQLKPSRFNMYNNDSYELIPQPGMIIFFPSQIHHKILTNKSNLTRYSLACNFVPTGDIYYKDTDSYLKI